MSIYRKCARKNSVEKLFLDDVKPKTPDVVPIGSFSYEKRPSSKKSLLNSPVRRRSVGEFIEEKNLIINKETEMKQSDSFEKEVQELLEVFPSISTVRISKSKVREVVTVSNDVSLDLPLSKCEENLGFRNLTGKNIPPILNTLRRLALILQNVKKFQDRDFYGKWITLARESLLDSKFATERIRYLRVQAKTLLIMAIKTKYYQDENEEKLNKILYWKDCLCEKSSYDIDSIYTISNGNTLHQTVYRNMAKFIIATFALNPVIENLVHQWDELEGLEPNMKNRIYSLLFHFFNVFFRFYNDYFCCNRDSCGNLVTPN